MSFLSSQAFLQQEERITRYLSPKRIILSGGTVTNAEHLLIPKPLQIDLYEPDVTALINPADSMERAWILLDFGFEFHGGVRLLTHGVGPSHPRPGNALAEAQVRLAFGESVSEALSELGQKGACNDHSPRCMTVPVAGLSDLSFGQTGFRFLRIELLSPDCRWTLKTAAGAFVYRDLPYQGSFRCSDPLLNQIYDTAAYTCHLNMQNLLWDGIKRDRLVWIGDAHPEMLTIRAVFGHVDMLDESLRFAREKAPLPRFMNGMPAYSLWWLLILRDYYMATGDDAFLAQNGEYAMALGRHMASFVDEDGNHALPAYFLDWPTAKTPAAEAGVHGLFILAMDAAAEMAGWLKDAEAAALFANRAAAMRRHCPDCHGAKQAMAMQALAGLRPMNEAARALADGGARGMSTFMSYYILKVMSEGDMTAALQVLREYYGGMLHMGATTFWEDFHVEWLENAAPIDAPVPAGKRDIHGDFGDFCYRGLRHSLCHGWASGPAPFLAERVLGIEIAAPGCRVIWLRPNLGDLCWAEGTFPTPYGILHVRADQQSVTYDAPDGVTVVTK